MKNIFGGVKSISFSGFSADLVNVEVQILKGLQSFAIVGLADKCIVESKDRIRGAFHSSGLSLPFGKIIVNLSPARHNKEGTYYDLPIALAILVASGYIKKDISQCMCLGELSLSGNIVFTNGGIQSIDFAYNNNINLISGMSYANEFGIYPKKPKEMYLANNLQDLIYNLNNNILYDSCDLLVTNEEKQCDIIPFKNVIGQCTAKRAMIISASGKHHMSLIGAPGVGKTTLVMEMPKLLPDLNEKQSIQVTTIYSLAGLLKDNKLIKKPILRSPHSSCSEVSLLGGLSPGECSLAHHGVLFLDEFPEFKCIDALRVPIESNVITISRASKKMIYPCDFLLMVAMNPCKCGLLLENRCVCGKKNYMSRISAPIQDRIDMKIYLSKPNINLKNYEKYNDGALMVENARDIQFNRWGKLNKDVDISLIDYTISEEGLNIIFKFAEEKSLSIRSINKIKRISRTIADLSNEDQISINHIYEAILFVNYAS